MYFKYVFQIRISNTRITIAASQAAFRSDPTDTGRTCEAVGRDTCAKLRTLGSGRGTKHRFEKARPTHIVREQTAASRKAERARHAPSAHSVRAGPDRR